MRRFGYSLLIIIFFFLTAAPSGCDTTSYDEKEMGGLATLARVVMDIVSSEYIDKPVPQVISEAQIKEIVTRVNTNFEELKLLDKYDMVIVSNGTQMACVIWDPGNGRKLIQDLRCTPKLDEPAWRQKVFGNDFTLSWATCGSAL
jgi:hypothetical protein